MRASDFVATYGKLGPDAWEAAALSIARQGGLTPWPWQELRLTDGQNTAVLQVMSDVLSIGPVEDHLRLPMLPNNAQGIFNLFGWLMPTPWLVYQTWRSAPHKLVPIPAVPNRGANMAQYVDHNAAINQTLIAAGGRPGDGRAVDGIKKSIVVSNIHKPGKVLIHGWYKPEPDVFDDGKSWQDPTRQPRQAKSNVHGDFYVDYSHGLRPVHPVAIVNGQPMPTVSLYQHPTLSALVSNEGPVRVPRYPSRVPVTPIATPVGEVAVTSWPGQSGAHFVPSVPSVSDYALWDLYRRHGGH